MPQEHPTHSPSPLRSRLLLWVAWAAAVTVVAAFVNRFWIPLDDGTLAQSAERVLRGELPHRDFGDPYTGLNAVVGALAFRTFGVALTSLRIPLVVGFALWIPAVWLLSRRFLGESAAIVAVLVAACLSVLAYPAAMPTWFALFAVTWGAWLAVRFMDTDGRGWLFAAGVAAGIAILFKVVGLYFVAATLLSLAWHRGTGHRADVFVSATACALFLAALGRLVLPGGGATTVFHFFLPALALCLALLAALGRRPSAGSGAPGLVADGLILLAGTLIPIVVFLVPYATGGGVGVWVEGVFLLPGRRLRSAASPPGDVWTVVPALALVAVTAPGSRLEGEWRLWVAIGLLGVLALALALDDVADGGVTAALWYSLRGFVPALALWGGWILARRGTPADAPLFLLVATAALWTLVQFPYFAPAYFFYVAPLGVVATGAVLARGPSGVGPTSLVVAGMAAFLGAGYATGVVASGTTLLDLDRGGIYVSAGDAAIYDELVDAVDAHIGSGSLWAGPDAPEVYYLTGRPNPTPTLYEFLAVPSHGISDTDSLPVPQATSVVVINTSPLFSQPLGAAALDHLTTTFPDRLRVGSFLVRWRAP